MDRVLASYSELLKDARSVDGSDELRKESEEISRPKIPLYCKNKLLIVGLIFILVYELIYIKLLSEHIGFSVIIFQILNNNLNKKYEKSNIYW